MVGHDQRFQYVKVGWEGSAHDTTVFNVRPVLGSDQGGRNWSSSLPSLPFLFQDCLQKDLRIPEGKYLLADGGYPLLLNCLIPFRSVRYHLNEWRKIALQ